MKKVALQNGVATKQDLFAMEKRLRHDLASKDDLKGFVTKEDLKNFATKEELNSLEMKIDYKIDSKFSDYMDKLDVKLFEWKSQIFNLVDGLAKMAKDKEEDKTIHFGWHDDLNSRVNSLEKIHPQGTHTIT